jgi:hypothetical protein
MDIFYKRNLTNLEVLAPYVVKLTYNDGYYKVHSNTIWSVHRNADGSGNIHLFQDGAGGSIGYFGTYFDADNTVTLGGVTYSDPDLVLAWFIANLAE